MNISREMAVELARALGSSRPVKMSWEVPTRNQWDGLNLHSRRLSDDVDAIMDIQDGISAIADLSSWNAEFVRGIAVMLAALLVGRGDYKKVAPSLAVLETIERCFREISSVLSEKKIDLEDDTTQLESIKDLEAVFDKIVNEVRSL